MVPFEFLGPYRLADSIGRGGMGTVYRAAHVKTGQPVAVKLIADSVADDPRFRRRFAAEVETLKRLKHPNIVTLIGYGEQAGHLFYSMELVEGESLQQKLRREKRLAWQPVLDMAIEICAALKHAHDFGIIHRDLKPANLLITNDGTIKLVDFGIAKLFGNLEQTAAGSVLGTADFMAPEQADGAAITPRTDLYSLGNVLYACFAGRPPFAGRTLTRVIESLRQDTPSRLDLISPDLPVEIVELVHDLLNKRPADRPPTALAVMNRMKAIRAGLNRTQTQMADQGDTLGGDSLGFEVTPLSPSTPPTDSNPSRDEKKSAQTDQPTAVTRQPDKTRVKLDVGHNTLSGPDASDELTVEATVPSGEVGDKTDRNTAVTPVNQNTVGPKSAADEPLRDSIDTHFRTVDDKDRVRSAFEHEVHADDSLGKLGQILTVLAMLACLGIGVAALVWASRTPSSDELYRSIVKASESNDLSSLRNLSSQFLRLYPDDPQFSSVQAIWEDINTDAYLNTLKRKADSGVVQLPIDEQALVFAVSELEDHPALTIRRLEQWLDLFGEGAGNAAEPSDAKITVAKPDMTPEGAARNKLKRLRGMSPPEGDRRAAALFDRIRNVSEQLPPEEQRKAFEAIVGLFGEQPWARPAVTEATRRLESLDR